LKIHILLRVLTHTYVKKLSSNYMHIDEKSNRITRPVVNIKLVLAGYQPK
jgi:hypothetical protein